MGCIGAETVAVVANMVESALRAGGVDAERGAEGPGVASTALRGGVSAAVFTGAGAVQRPLDRASVRVRGRGREARWAAERILVVDGDLGVSGRDAQSREGYKELVGRVCLGEVGAIFGLEVSRLGRSNADLQRLLELCGLTDTLIVDLDGIYDLHDFNDRLLLGLKGQMSEAELHMITSRLQGAKRAAAERGELRFPLPVGYVRDDEGQTIIDPDEEVRAAIADLFCAFEQTGSAYGVVGVFKGRRFPTRAYGGAWAGELRWGR